jgi:hypothetical protein
MQLRATSEDGASGAPEGPAGRRGGMGIGSWGTVGIQLSRLFLSLRSHASPVVLNPVVHPVANPVVLVRSTLRAPGLSTLPRGVALASLDGRLRQRCTALLLRRSMALWASSCFLCMGAMGKGE